MASTRLALCRPIYRTVEGESDLSFARLVRHEMARGTHVEILGSIGSMISWARSALATEAVKLGCHSILWVDSDMVFHEDAAEHLLGTGKPYIGANCLYRDGTAFTAKRDGQEVVTYRSSTGIEVVDELGFGLTLTDCSLFTVMERPWFDVIEAQGHKLGEDYYFAMKCREQNVLPWISHDLSKRVGHLGTARYIGCAEDLPDAVS